MSINCSDRVQSSRASYSVPFPSPSNGLSSSASLARALEACYRSGYTTPNPIKICLKICLTSPELTLTQPTRVSHKSAVISSADDVVRYSMCCMCSIRVATASEIFLGECNHRRWRELGSCSARRAFSRAHESSRKIQCFLFGFCIGHAAKWREHEFRTGPVRCSESVENHPPHVACSCGVQVVLGACLARAIPLFMAGEIVNTVYNAE